MSTRRKRIIFFASVILAVAVGLIVSRKREPEYRGRRLSEWLIDLGDSPYSGRQSPKVLAASEAIRHIGTNALPYLVERLRYNPDSGTRKVLVPMIDHLPQAIVPGRLSDWRRGEPGAANAERAIHAIQVLGTNAFPALPELTQMAQDPTAEDPPIRALRALYEIGPPAIPAFYQIILNTNAPHRDNAVGALAFFGTNSFQAVSFLIRCLDDPDEDVSVAAVASLGGITADAQASVPALIQALQDPNPWKRMAAAEALGNFGAAATPAIPTLRLALTDTNSEVQREVRSALHRISETLTNAPAK